MEIFILVNSVLFLLLAYGLKQTEEVAFGFFLLGFLVMALPLGVRRKRRAMMLLWGLLVSSLVHILIYEQYTHLNFSLFQLIENPLEAIESVIFTLGNFATILVVIEFFFTAFAVAAAGEKIILRAASRFEGWRGDRRRRLALQTAALLLFVPATINAVNLARFYTSKTSPIEMRFEGDPEALPHPGESLIILQLESVSGMALFKNEDGRPPRVPLVGLKTLADMGGVWIPYFWSNTFGTNLGMASILCATSGASTNRLVKPDQAHPCLPERFRRAGFHTTFYYSFRATDFYDMEANVKTMGFDDFFYGAKLMKPSDPFYRWGYDDCKFYDRAFDHMRATGLDQRKDNFIYMSVHMNHFPYTEHLQTIAHPYSQPASTEESYLNSAVEQDYCVGHFLDRVKSLGRKDLHVMIVGDHSVPIDPTRGVYGDYTTSFFYLPAAQRASEFKKGSLSQTQPAQDQILPTVLELFGSTHQKASFLWLLRGAEPPEDYRNCALISGVTANWGLVTQGDDMVQKLYKLNKFVYIHNSHSEPKFQLPLDIKGNWKKVPLTRACLERLGTPQVAD